MSQIEIALHSFHAWKHKFFLAPSCTSLAIQDIGRSIEDQIEAEYKLRIELLGKMRSHARQKCQAALSEVSSAISDVDRRLDEELSSYDQDGRAGGDNGNTWTADKAERSQDTFPKRLAELRQELNAIDVSSLVSFDPRSFRVSVVSSAVRNGRDPQRRMLATAEGSSDSRSVSPAVRRVMGAEANTEEATSTESAARSSNKPRMGTSVVLSRGQNLPPSVASIATLRKKRPLSRTKALSGSEDLAALGLAFGLGREAPNGLMSTLSPASSLASLRSNNNANASSPSLRRVNSNASDNSRLTTYHDRGATANHTGSLAVRTKPRRTAILNATNEETGLLYKVTNFTTRIVVTSHQLLRPSGLVVCPWIVNANGRITATRATTRPANPADFFGASANDVDNGDNGSVAFLVVSADLHRVCLCRVEERGETTITKLFGKRGEAPGQFLHPVGIAVDRKRREIYVTDNWQHCVHVFSTDGKFLRRWGMRGTAPGHFTSPGGIAIDDERRDGPVVYLCDCGNNRVQILDPDGIFIGFLGSDPFSSSDDPAPRRSPAMDRNGNGAASFMLESKQELLVDTGFDEPISVAVDYRTGNVVVADSGNDRIKVYQTKDLRRPLLLSVFGSSGRWTGMFKKPDCVALDPDGFVFVAENGTRRVQVFTQDGEFVTQATRDFRWAGGMAVTSDRRMLIADYEKNQIRIVY